MSLDFLDLEISVTASGFGSQITKACWVPLSPGTGTGATARPVLL